MVLDARLKKLATGVSVQEAVRAHARSLQPGVVLDDEERKKADEIAAIIDLMFLMAAVDGEVAKGELERLAASVDAMMEGTVDHAPDLIVQLGEAAERLSRDGWSACLEATVRRIRSEESRQLAFRLAAGVAFVDDHVAHAEAAALESLTASLGLSGDESLRILREVQDELFGG